MTEDVLSKS